MKKQTRIYLTEHKDPLKHRVGPYLESTSFEKAREMCPEKYKVVGRSKPIGKK